MHHADSSNGRYVSAPGIDERPRRSWSETVDGRLQGDPIVVDSLVSVSTLSGSLQAFEASTGERYGSATIAALGTPAAAGDLCYGQLPGDGGLGPFGGFDRRHQERQWDHPVDGLITSPVVDRGRIFASSIDEPYVYRFDAETGTQDWRVETVGRPRPVAVEDSRVFVTTDSYLLVYDAETGDRRWETLRFDQKLSTPLATDGGVAVTSGGSIVAVDSDGRRWTDAPFDAPLGSMAGDDTSLVAGGPSGVRAYSAGDGDQRWTTHAVTATKSLVLADEVVYAAGDTTVTGMDRSTGESLWSLSFDAPVVGLSAVPEWAFVLTSEQRSSADSEGTIHALDGA